MYRVRFDTYENGMLHHKVGRYVRYDWADVRRWIATRKSVVGAA